MSPQFKVTPKVLSLIEDLYSEGYQGQCKFTNEYYSGTKAILGDHRAMELTGFCKESLSIVEDAYTGDILLVGRYQTEKVLEIPRVVDIVQIAWEMYKSYKTIGYSKPDEFHNLFIKYGYIKIVQKTTEEEIENDQQEIHPAQTR
jgi:hypothetical protein